MKQLWFILAAALIGSGCATQDSDSQEKEDQAEEKDENATGGLALSLVSSDSQGRPYRLRNASFTISSDFWFGGSSDAGAPQSLVIDTDSFPDQDRLSIYLARGAYLVSLGGEWYVERLTAGGWERVEQVVLLSESVQYAYVDSGWNSDLDFRFGVDGTLIDFRSGDLNIDISIELPGEQQSYDGGVVFPRDASVLGDGGGPFFP